MIKHIVLFKLNDSLTNEKRKEIISNFKLIVELLPQKIEQLLFAEVRSNINPKETFDISLIAHVEKLEDIAIYDQHPEHQKAVAVLRGNVAQRSCVDCNY